MLIYRNGRLFRVEDGTDAEDVLEVGNGLCRAFACDPQGEIAAHRKAQEVERLTGFVPCHGLDGGEDSVRRDVGFSLRLDEVILYRSCVTDKSER